MPPLAFSTLACRTWSLAEVLGGVNATVTTASRCGRLPARPICFRSPTSLRPGTPSCGERWASWCVAICGLASSVRFDYPEQAARDEQLRTGQAYVELAASLGARFVRVFGDVLPSEDSGTRQVALDAIAEGLSRLGSSRPRTTSTFCSRRTEILQSPRSSAS